MSDYISREAALTELQNPELFNVSPRFLQILRDLPTADVEPVRHGNWNIRLADEMTLCLECSICGRKVDNIDLHHLLEAGEYGEAWRIRRIRAMTIDRAIETLDPEHRECYDGMDEVNEACRMGMEALERTRWVPCSERLPDLKPQKAGIGLDYTYSDVVYVWTTGGKAMTGIWDGITWIAPFPFWDAWEERITHWKPIYPPKG